MRFFRVALAVSTLSVLPACTDPPTAPDGALIGRWGGVGAELTASVTSVRVDLPCAPGLTTRGPLVPGGGRFVLSLSYPVRRPATGPAVTVRGAVSNDTIAFDAITVTLHRIETAQYSVVRNRPADFSTVACFVAF